MEEIPNSKRKFPARVATVTDSRTIVINRGARDGVKMGTRFLVYKLGPSINDPETGEDLGELEIIVGTGIISHIQENMSQLTSDQLEPIERKITRKPSSILGAMSVFASEEIENVRSAKDILPFKNPSIGDFVRPV